MLDFKKKCYQPTFSTHSNGRLLVSCVVLGGAAATTLLLGCGREELLEGHPLEEQVGVGLRQDGVQLVDAGLVRLQHALGLPAPQAVAAWACRQQ